jgi:GT2 family glycosyltransferase
MDATEANVGTSGVGIVVVGRNEGKRLEGCIASATRQGCPMVYVDSGSSDGSATWVRATGIPTWELDTATPFSAARARNEGFEHLMNAHPALQYVQFLDGDCEICPDWLVAAAAELSARCEVAMACGRIIERAPDASPYNRLCALEWDRPAGEVTACGGNFMVRVEAFRRVGGFRPEVVAAEDDELCLRVRRQNGTIVRLAADMVRHDSALLRFSQWWRRAKRCGHAYAQGKALHGKSSERHFVRECRSTLFWGGLVPALALGSLWWHGGVTLLLLTGFPVLWLRIYLRARRRGWPPAHARLYANFTVLAKLPAFAGMVQFHANRWRGRLPSLIEHKEPSSS